MRESMLVTNMSRLSLPDVLRAFGATRNQLNYWAESGVVVVPPGVRGVATPIHREIALRIAFIATLTNVGYEPQQALQFARAHWLDALKRGEKPARFWILNSTRSSANHAARIPNLEDRFDSLAEWIEMAGEQKRRGAAALIVIDLHEILDRLDYLESDEKRNN